MSLPLSSVGSEEAALFTFLSKVCFFSVASMILCTCLLRRFSWLQQRRWLREQQRLTNGDAVDEKDDYPEKSTGVNISSSHNSGYLDTLNRLRPRKPQAQASASSASIESAARSKAREELACELQALKALQADVKLQLNMLQGLAAKKTPNDSQQANPRTTATTFNKSCAVVPVQRKKEN